MDTSLVGYWRMDDNAANATVVDQTGINNGTFNDATGDPNTDAHSVAGQVGNALDFDGTDDYVNIPYASNLDAFTAFTFSTWINPTSNPTVDYERFLEKDWMTNGSFTFTTRSNLRVNFEAQNDAGTSVQVLTTDTLPLNTWAYITAVWDGANITIYINGMPKASGSFSGTLTNNQYIRIGSHKGGTTGFHGLIDEVRIYNRALSAEEIRKQFSRGRRGVGPFITSFKE